MSKEELGSPKTDAEQNLVVALRLRPINEDEIIQHATPVVYAMDKKLVVLMDPQDDPDDVLRANRSRQKNFAYDVVFDGSSTQKEVYDQTAKLLIPSVIQGYNATVFAYGATGAGKTYTMLGTDEEPGVMARSLNDLFQEMRKTNDEMVYRVTMSYLEIYNEMIRDLLNPGSGVLELREDSKGNTQVAGLTHFTAKSTREVMAILSRGNRERSCEPTAANKTSSRSHAVLQISVKQRGRARDVMQQVVSGKLFLIDLAGSERAANTHNTGKRMVEGAHINRSLLALGNCINALCDKAGARYVNYRDSKLTRLLKESLGGNCRTVMIAHVSPASNHFEESRNTLVYADRAKNIKTKVRKNVLDVSYHIAQYTNIISELSDEVNRLRARLHDLDSLSLPPTVSRASPRLDKLKQQLIDVFGQQMELRRNLMSMNNTAMEINLDYTRNNLVIKKFESEKALRINPSDDNSSLTTFLTEGGEGGADEQTAVRAARLELSTLSRERQRTETLRQAVFDQLALAKVKAAQIEEMLTQETTEGEQQEVLGLLCKVHELEIENMEVQSTCLLRNFELRKAELVLATYEQHRVLCEDLIGQQRALMEAQGLAPGPELLQLYDLHMQQSGELAVERNFSLPEIGNGSTTVNGSVRAVELESAYDWTPGDRSVIGEDPVLTRPRIHLPSDVRGPNSVAANRTLAPRPSQPQDDKSLFSRTARSPLHFRDRGAAQVPATGTVILVPRRPDSIITLSNHSASTSPPSAVPPESPELDTFSDIEDDIILQGRRLLSRRTRNITTLAQRRTKAQHDAYNSRLIQHNKRTGFGGGGELTRSRLAQHDADQSSHQGSSLGVADASQMSMSQMTYQIDPSHNLSVAKQRPQQKAAARQRANRFGASQHRRPVSDLKTMLPRPNASTSSFNGKMHSPERRSKLPRRTHIPTRPMPTHSLQFAADDGALELRSTDSPTSLVKQTAPERGNGLTVKRNVRGPNMNQTNYGGDTRSVHKSEGTQSKKNEKKASDEAQKKPTIPVYATADIGVTGYSLQQKQGWK